MSRLTRKLGEGFYVAFVPNTDTLKEKLGKLEDIEEGLGCPLEVVFKALTFGFVNSLKEKFSTNEYNITLWKTDFGWVLYITGLGCYPLKDYGKTWWLKGDKE